MSPPRAAVDVVDRPVERFLDGRVVARQPSAGYRAAVDTVLLGAAIDPEGRARGAALELGCGPGTALLIAAARNPDLTFVGLEREPDLVALAMENVRANSVCGRVEIVRGDAFATPPEWRGRYSEVFFNPPYLDDAGAARPPLDPARRAAFINDAGGAADWIAAALALTAPRGRVTLVHRADRLADLLSAFEGKAGEIRIRPIQPRVDAPARRVVVRARKGVRSPLAILPGLALHDGADGWTAEANAILKGDRGLALEA